MKLIAFFCAVILFVALFYGFGGAQYLELSVLGELLQQWRAVIAQNWLLYSAITGAMYVVLMSSPLPITAISIVSSGYLFGFWLGLPLILISSMLAATLTFLLCRYVFSDSVQGYVDRHLSRVSTEIERAGFWYSLSLRLSGVVPFFLLNCVQAVTPLKLQQFALATFLGMVPVSMVLVNAGTRLAEIDSVRDVLDAKIALSFLLVAMLPLVIRMVLPNTKTNQGQ